MQSGELCYWSPRKTNTQATGEALWYVPHVPASQSIKPLKTIINSEKMEYQNGGYDKENVKEKE